MKIFPHVVPRVGLEPTRPQGTTDFESAASTIPPPRHRCVISCLLNAKGFVKLYFNMWYKKPAAVWHSARAWLRNNQTLFLALVAFTENVIPTPPAELVLVPMAALQPQKAHFYGILTSVASALGAVAGYVLGYTALAAVRTHWPSLGDNIDQWLVLFQSGTLTTAGLLFLSALLHVPPSKVACVVSGAAGVPLWLFVGVTGVVRGAKFMALAYAAPHFAPQLMAFLQRHKKTALWIGGGLFCAVLLYMWNQRG